MVTVLIGLLIIAIVIGVAWFAIKNIDMPEQVRKFLTVILVVVAAVWVIYLLLGVPGAPAWR